MKILLSFAIALLAIPLPATPASSAEGQTAFGHWTAPDEINSSLYRGGLYAFWLPVPDYSLAFQGFCSHPHTWPLYCYYKLYR